MGTRHAASRPGTSRRTMASARSSAMRGRPPYFSACAAARAPASSQTAERAACSAAGQSAHNRQGPKCGSGWPQRRHHGGWTGRQRWRQMSHTTRRDVGKETGARHRRHWAGRSSCSSASRTERRVHGGPHHLEWCRVAREKARKGSRPLAYQHLAAVLRPYSRRAEHPHPASAPGRVDEVERGAEAWRAAGIERQGVALLQAQGGGVDRDVRVERSPRGFGLGATAARPAGEVAGARGVARQYVELALTSAAATATARALPPVPTRIQRPPSAPSCFRHATIPGTSVLSPTSAPCSVQNVLHAPTRSHRSVFRARHRSAASLCGTVTFPAAPTAASAPNNAGRAAAGAPSATYTASRPRARIAALCMTGDSEWVTGSPITASRRVFALTSTRALLDDPIHRRLDERLEFGACVAVHAEVAAERVAHLGLVTLAAGVLPEHEDVPFTAQLVDAGPVMARHGEDEVGRLHQLAREQPRAVSREIEPALQPDEVRALGHRGPVPRARPGGRDINPLDGPLGEGALQQRRPEGAAANVAGAHQQDLCRLRHLGHGASRPAARRSSESVIAPSRTSRGVGRVQSTTVDGGEFPSTPPSNTSSVPASTAGAKSRAIASAPGAAVLPGKLADVEVTGSPTAPTSRAMPRCDVHRTAMPPSGPRRASGSRPLPPRTTNVSA